MSFSNEIPKSFRLFVTHVDGEGHFLKLSGQLDQQASLMVESLFETARKNLESGIGSVSPAAIHEGIICAAKYKDGTYYRAKIINTTNLSNGLVGVHFIDYGNKDYISLSTIRYLDNYDPMFLQLPGQATDYCLSRVFHPTGRWEEPLLLKVQSLLCYAEYPAVVDAQTCPLPIISVQFKGFDLSSHLVANRFGVALPLANQEKLLQQSNENQQVPNWQPTFINETQSFEHVPFLTNQGFPSNPASAMRLQQSMNLPYNGTIQTHTGISQRLLVNKTLRAPVNLKAPVRQPQQVISKSSPSNTIENTPSSPKKAITYKSRILEINSQHKVFVSFAEEGPELFAVQLVSDAKKLQDMMDEINRRPHSSLTEPPMIGTVCLGRMSGDRIICRAIVMNLSGVQCKLFFVDFGDTEMVSYYDIFDIPEEFVKPNVFAMRFCLSGVKKLEKSPHLNEGFKQLVNGKVLTLKVVSPEGPPLIQYGELFLENKNVLELLLGSTKDKHQFKWMEPLTHGSRCSVLVSYVDSCMKFYVQLSDRIGDLNAVMDAVRKHCENISVMGELAVGTACCARFPDDGNWYRARIIEIKNKRIVVAYVDYGNEQEVDVSDLRTITPELISLPAQALKCALKGYENRPVETTTSNQLEMLALEKTLMAHIVGTLPNHTMIVTLIDDTAIPPLDIARRMNQLSQPRSNVDVKTSPPVHKEAVQSNKFKTFSSPEGSEKSTFTREKSFKDDRQRPPRDDDFNKRGGSFRNRENKEFDRSGPGRQSEKFGGRHDRGERRQGYKPADNNATAANDDWKNESTSPVTSPPRQNREFQRRKQRSDTNSSEKGPQRPQWRKEATDVGKTLRQAAEAASNDVKNFSKTTSIQDRLKRDNKYNKQDNRDDNKTYDSGNRNDSRPERREFRGDKKEGGFQKREFNKDRGERTDRYKSNFTPRDRANRSFNSQDSGSRSAPYKNRSNFTQIECKELSNPMPLDTKFQEPSVELGSQHEVSVTWIISPESFYTQIMSLQPKFLDMMNKIPELYKGVKSYTGPVEIGASVLARYPVDGVLYRATIVAVQPFSKFIVRYVDFGNKQLVDVKDLWQMDEALIDLPKMAVHCSLLGVAPKDGEWKADPQIDLCFNAPRAQCVFQELAETQYKVSLYNNGVSVADTLVEKMLAVKSELPGAVTLKDEAIDMTIIINQQILCRITHVVNYDKFYVHLDIEKADLVENAIANYDSSLLTPLAASDLYDGGHVTVKHEDKIYRGILNDVSDTSNIKAVLPDFGKEITTSLGNVMVLPTELSVYFYQSLICSLNNFTTESNTLMTVDELKEKLTGNKFLLYINDVVDATLSTTLYDCVTGEKVSIFEPDEGAYETVSPLNSRTVFNYNFGNAYISHLENLNEIYLQKATDSDRIAILLEKMFTFYEEGKPDELKSFECDEICAAKSSDSNWYRAIIISATEEEIEVQFSDYGNRETIPKDSVKILDSQFYEPCSLALVVSLGLVALQDDATSKLTEWTTDKETLVTLDLCDDGWLASLHLDGVNLSMKLIEEKLAAPQNAATEEQPVTPAKEETSSLPEGCTQVYISHIDTPGHFWIQMLDKAETLEQLQADLQTNTNAYADVENRDIGTVCIAKYIADDQWYRAEILDSDADITTVRFIDYGNTDVLDNIPGLIKVMPEAMKDIDNFAIKSSVNAVPTGTGQWSEPASEFFTELVGDLSNPVDVLVVLKDVTTYVDIYVNGQNLTDKLVSEGHASRSEENDCGDLPSCFASHVNSPSEFWIQLESATSELQSVESAMVDAENFPELTDKEEGVLCAAKYPEDGAWYRAQVIVDGSEGTEVLFMDYGNASITTELRNLPDDLKVKPALSRKCALQKSRDIKSWSRKSEDKFNELAAEGATIFNVQFIASGDISIVELYLKGKSVTEELVSLCEAYPASERPTPVGQDVHNNGKIKYVKSPAEFYIQLHRNEGEISKVTERLKAGSDFESISELKVGSLCASFCLDDEQWYRAKILEFCDSGYHVQFIDFGNKSKCEDFRQLPEDVACIEPLAKCCQLAGVEGSDDNAKQKLEELASNEASLQIEFLDTTKEPILVKILIDNEDFCNNIKKQLTENDENKEIVEAKDIDEVTEDIDEVTEDISEVIKDVRTTESEDQLEILDKSQDLNESIESNKTVIEVSSTITAIDTENHNDQAASCETLDVSSDTKQTTDTDNFEDCLNTDTEVVNDENKTSVTQEQVDDNSKSPKKETSSEETLIEKCSSDVNTQSVTKELVEENSVSSIKESPSEKTAEIIKAE